MLVCWADVERRQKRSRRARSTSVAWTRLEGPTREASEELAAFVLDLEVAGECGGEGVDVEV